jgi:glycosyltransferase involved in cell wall biosynthesis
VITFEKNYGQSSAFDAGFRAAKGTWVITLDGDRQNDPQDIPKLIALSDKHDLVVVQRVKRKDPFVKKITSYLANVVRSRICRDGMRDANCSLKLYRKSALDRIPLYDGMHRFLPALFLIYGYTIGQVPVNHRPRTAGKTKYSFYNRSFNTVLDMFAVAWIRKRALRYQVKRGPHG